MRILHLAYEDPRQPGSGGGSKRTWEVDRRLSQRHEVTAIVAGYPGAEERVEDGIHWVPVGTSRGSKIDRLSYFALAAPQVLRYPHDLVVEDFGPPFSVACSPLLTRSPVIASVQWLFASEMSKKYHLPFHWAERLGLHLYTRFIAVSQWVEQRLSEARPEAEIVVIPEGVDDLAYSVRASDPKHLLYVGRLDVAQKGGDLLLEIIARAAATLGSRMPKLLVVGDGPDRGIMEQLAESLKITHLVEFLGRIDGTEKFRLMAAAHAVLMPSRFETFGIVAIEGQAVGVPVVAFDVGPLSEVAGGGGAYLVKAFHIEDFANEVVRLVTDPTISAHRSRLGREWARRYNWDEIASRQEVYYLDVVRHQEKGFRQD